MALCFPGISLFLNGSPGHAELCRLENSCGVQGWDLPTRADTTYGLFLVTVLAPGGHHPCCFLIPSSRPTASPSGKKKGGEGGRRGHGLRFFCGLSNIALNYVLTGRCQEQLCQRGGAIVGHHCGGCIFGKMNFLHLHSERKRNLALFLYLVQDHHLYKPNVTQDI